MKVGLGSFCLSCLSTMVLSCGVFAGRPPETKRVAVAEVFHGESVVEEYRWLEDQTQPDVRQWMKVQNQHTREFLDALPGRQQIRDQLTKLYSSSSVLFSSPVYRAGQYFALRYEPGQQHETLVTLQSLDAAGSFRFIVDPNKLAPDGSISIDWFEPSPDGKLVAVSLSTDGSEAGDVHVYDLTREMKEVDVVTRVNAGTAGGDLAWSPDSSGFYYTRYPRPGERPDDEMGFFQQGWYHRIGTPAESDRYELGKDFPRIAEIEFEMHDESGQLLVTVQDGDSGRFAHFLRSPKGEYRQFSTFDDNIVQATFGSGDSLFVLTRKQAPRGSIIRLSTATLSVDEAQMVVPHGPDTIVNSFYRSPPSIAATETRLFVLYQLGGPSEIRVFDHSGRLMKAPEQAAVSTVDGMSPLPNDRLLFTTVSYVTPETTMLFDSLKQTTTRVPAFSDSTPPLKNVTVKREFATSKDGTRIPVNILSPSTASADKPGPCIVYGYGGYAISVTPEFDPTLQVLLDAGCRYAVANLRGGSEFGEDWHQQGMLLKKQNVFDDFAAACQYMISQGYTTSEQLGIMGRSNGGLLMGAMVTQHPQLFKTSVAHVGIYDMLRNELSTNGSFNIPEFGSVKHPDQFRALRAYSPYHNVKDGVEYPSMLFITAENDPRVDPMQSRKMTARLQAATKSENPILLRISATGGHGLSSSLNELIDEGVDVYSFLLNELAPKK